MKLNAKEIKRLVAIKNSFYEDFKIEFVYASNLIEGSTFKKENLEKRLDEKMAFYQDTLELVKKEIREENL